VLRLKPVALRAVYARFCLDIYLIAEGTNPHSAVAIPSALAVSLSDISGMAYLPPRRSSP